VKIFIKKIIGYILILILKTLKVVVVLRFARIYTSRIGHLSVNIDLIISKEKKSIFFFSTDNFIANRYLLKIYKNTKRIFFFNLVDKIISCIRIVDLKSEFILDIKDLQPEFNYFFHKKNNIKIENNDTKFFYNFLKKNKISKQFICFHNRDSAFLKKDNFNDNNSHDYRDFNFNVFIKSIKSLSKNNSIVRIGSIQDRINFKYKNFFDRTNDSYNPKLDILFNYFAKYIVISGTGLAGVGSLFRKKIAYVNLIPFSLNQLSYCSPDSIILPKKIYSKILKRYLTFSEMNRLNFNVHNAKNFFEKQQLTIVNNSEKEIYLCVKEMEMRFNNSRLNNSQKVDLQKRFWSVFEKQDHKKILYLKEKLRIKINTDFLINNPNLL
jgi:putative glycosyltransferase (TIGR04372 family)